MATRNQIDDSVDFFICFEHFFVFFIKCNQHLGDIRDQPEYALLLGTDIRVDPEYPPPKAPDVRFDQKCSI